MVDLNPQQLGLELGGGAVIGGVIGFAAKKVAKIIAVLVGIQPPSSSSSKRAVSSPSTGER